MGTEPDTAGWELPPDTASALDWMDVGFVTLDQSWRMTRVNDAASAILGRPVDDLIGHDLWETFPGARELAFGRAYESVMATRTPVSFDAYYPALGVWFELRVRPVPGGIACYFLDISARKAAEQGLAANAERATFMADAMESLAATLDVAANAEHLVRLVVPRLCTWASVSVLGDDGVVIAGAAWHEDPARRDEVMALARRGRGLPLAAVESAKELPDHLRSSGSVTLPLAARGRTVGRLTLHPETPWTDGQADVARDVSARAAAAMDNSLAYARAEIARREAQVAGRRLAMLARVSEVLSDTTDPDAAVGELAHLVVPELGDWCLVTVVEDDGNLRDVGYAHRDAALEPTLAAYSARRSSSMSDTAPRSTVLQRAEPLIVEHFSPDDLAAAQTDPAALALVRSLDPHGLATIPLTSRGRVLGVITLVTTGERGPHTPDEVASALEVGRRAGPVLETARAARHAQRLAESVQRSVLAIPPPPPGLQIATRYRPANLEHEVGGDWYDTFTTADGSTVITIGDVMGHDVVAIAAMAQLRTFMQACAWTVQHSPAEVLTATDRAGFGLGRRTFATAWTADLAPPAADGTVHMRWSNAGHLPAVLITPDGTVTLLRSSPIDPPLGVSATVARHDHLRVLDPGSVVVLFTDGLIERRDRDLDEGLAQLVEVIGDAPGADLEALLDKLLVNLVGGTGNDDVALIAVRIGDPRAPGTAGASATRRTVLLPDDLTAAALAREQVRAACGHLPDERLEDAVLLASELVGNVLRHGRPPAVLTIDVLADGVKVGVTDAGPTLPPTTLRRPEQGRTSGRGLLIVQALASAWGVTPHRAAGAGAGKTVWFTIDAS